uniref:9 kDa protein n=1 Tax=Persimmon virus B TaxID=1493829 RepID=A0A0A8JCU5_9CLOS|nr:9 kDa protein [Persimmon virus B]
MDGDSDTKMYACQSMVWINTVYFVVWVVLTIYLHGESIKAYTIKLSIASLPFLVFNLLSLLLIWFIGNREQRRVSNIA